MDSIRQTVLPLTSSSLPVYQYSRRHSAQAARALSQSNETTFGIAISQTNDGTIDYVAIATQNSIYLIDVGTTNVQDHGVSDKDFFDILGSTKTTLAGFGMPRIVLRLHHHLKHHVRGVDLSTIHTRDTAWRPSKVVSKMCFLQDTFAVDRLWHENDQEDFMEKLCLRAWISAKVAAGTQTNIGNSRKVDTRHIRKDILFCLGTLLRQTDILTRAQPRVSNNQYESAPVNAKGKMQLVNARYRNRVRVSKESYVEAISNNGKVYRGTAKRVQGKTTHIQFEAGMSTSQSIQSIRVVGLDEPMASEKARDSLLLRVLQDETKLTQADFVRFVWFRTKEDTQRLQQHSAVSVDHPSLKPHLKHLNASQSAVVASMIDVTPLTVVHGPPGTGKTTTISSAAEIWSKVYLNPVWIIGQSNVSVKNIAEKLLKRNVDFKLIVSKEFYVEWHEHIYEMIQERLIRTDELPKDSVAMSRVIGSSRVMLSTLSLLSNPALDDNGTFKIVPVERLIVDEASQINVFEYMHVFHKFEKTLQKVCFFGDPEQLPPFGKDKAQTLQSIFEIDHLKTTSHFLDTQYRMPVPLGNFISAHVYRKRLKSDHNIKDSSCLRFVDTPRGVEEKSGVSWTNSGEVSTIIQLVRHYYRSKPFCVITPYDAQRSLIQNQLKQEGLPWEQVYNIDSFQGNEADYVLISLVRSNQIGFLHLRQRINVMLTRCRRGMVIVSRRSFLEGVARDTLVGRISAYWSGQKGEEGEAWVGADDIMNQRVHLPGSPGKNAPDPLTTPRLRSSVKGKHPGSQTVNPTPAKVFDVKSLFRKNPTPPIHAASTTRSNLTLSTATKTRASSEFFYGPRPIHGNFPSLLSVDLGYRAPTGGENSVSWAKVAVGPPYSSHTLPLSPHSKAPTLWRGGQTRSTYVPMPIYHQSTNTPSSVIASPPKDDNDGWITVGRRRRR